MSKVALLILVIACGPGCTIYNVKFLGKLPSRPVPLGKFLGKLPSRSVPLGAAEGQEPWGRLALDELGTLTLNGEPLRLPYAHEPRRFGAAFVDASALPPAWRPPHAPEGGFLVASLERMSPLAVAGLRPFDVVRALDGAAPASAGALAESLGRVEPGRAVRLDVLTPRGPTSIEAAALADIDASLSLNLFLFDYERSNAAWHFGLGPFTHLAYHWEAVYDSEKAPEGGEHPWPRYVKTSYWRFLFDLFQSWTWVDLATGRERTRWRLFGLGPEGEWKEAGS
ncbi:MAG: hypothetical protein HY721_25975 [Planctomycetes bacterium]|nr:hypothetical protein [Planctomycetota bacterium]